MEPPKKAEKLKSHTREKEATRIRDEKIRNYVYMTMIINIILRKKTLFADSSTAVPGKRVTQVFI